MKTNISIGVVIFIVVLGGMLYWLNNKAPATPPTFIINGQPVTLVNGRTETTVAPGSASKVMTQYFGNVATGDVSGDGAPDVAFILTQNSGGSGTFYFVVATLVDTDGGYQGTNAILLGDRIAPQTTEIRNGEIIVNYTERKAGEPMTAEPSVGVTKYLKVQGTTLVEIIK